MPTSSSPKVSVVIPCFNYGHYLAECIESVLEQTYPAHEIIVVDDESTDDTREVVQRYAEKGVTYIWQKNKGLAGTRNTGIRESTGDYYMTLDADDKLVPGALEEHIKLIDDDKCCAQNALMEFGDRHVINIPPKNTSLEQVMQANTMYCNTLFPKKAWEEVGGYDESDTMRLGYEDWEFNIRVLAAGYHVRTSDFIALRYRVHEGQMTQATAHPKRQVLYGYIYQKHRELYEDRHLTVAGLIQNEQ